MASPHPEPTCPHERLANAVPDCSTSFLESRAEGTGADPASNSPTRPKVGAVPCTLMASRAGGEFATVLSFGIGVALRTAQPIADNLALPRIAIARGSIVNVPKKRDVPARIMSTPRLGTRNHGITDRDGLPLAESDNSTLTSVGTGRRDRWMC